MQTQAQVVDQTFDGSITEDDQGYNIFDFCEGLQPVSVDQDWDQEETVYTFYDGSRIRVSGPSYIVE